MLTMLAIRSMAKARYTTTHIGHYGLGFDSYTHFTSPIRRYPDLMVHRLLTRYLIEGKPSADAAALEDQCDHASEMESVAANAERASIKYKQVEYMIPAWVRPSRASSRGWLTGASTSSWRRISAKDWYQHVISPMTTTSMMRRISVSSGAIRVVRSPSVSVSRSSWHRPIWHAVSWTSLSMSRR